MNWVYLNPIIIIKNLNPKYFLPNLSIDSINDIDTKALEKQGIKAYMFDLDNTLSIHGKEEINPYIKKAFERITEKYPSCILSNQSKKKMRELENKFEVPLVQITHKKPHLDAYRNGLNYLKTKPQETAIIGDRFLSDIAGANILGIYTIKIRPLSISSEPLYMLPARVFEGFFYWFYKTILKI